MHPFFQKVLPLGALALFLNPFAVAEAVPVLRRALRVKPYKARYPLALTGVCAGKRVTKKASY